MSQPPESLEKGWMEVEEDKDGGKGKGERGEK